MTANSPGSVTESASSTDNPDAQARRANDGEPSAGFPSDLTIDQDAVDGILTAEEFAAECDENLHDGKLHAEYRRLAAEQAALRRLAMLVAQGVEPSEVFGAVAEEMRRCVPADAAGLWRFESDRETISVAAAADPATLAKWPVGTRTPVEGNIIATLVQRSGRPARIDSYDNVAGPIAARVRAVGVRAVVAVPIIIDGRVWGLAAVGSAQPGPMPADTEVRIGRFAELIATAVVAGYRDEQKRQLLAEASQRASLIDALLEGRAFDEWSLREVAGSLRLPINGPFVVIAAQAPTVGDGPLREIESKLRSLDIFSAWRRQPDVQVGIVPRQLRPQTRRRCCPHVSHDHRAGGSKRGLRGSARYATSPACRTSDVAGPNRLHILGRGVRRLDPGHRGSQRPRGDGQVGPRCSEPFHRPSRRGARDAFRNVSGVAGQRCVRGWCG
ncbi:MAG: hypothetical protein QOI79_3479 [Mycobacterium sp.]|jgi:hypothetical protein|nr:hypothetical protein [Mycobacterium sp.]